MIIEANDESRRQATQKLFETCFSDLPHNAIPKLSDDHLYKPIILQYIDDASGALAGAAMTLRAQIAVGHLTAEKMGMLSGENPYRSALNKHSELDLMCVAPEYRRCGIGTKLIEQLDRRLRKRGVRVWFGCVTEDLEIDQLRKFYSRHGFTVLENGQPLPPLLGRNWIMPDAEPPAFYFYKRL
ncbi:GNAT family N-acetyltransferase [Actinomadura geliboluensis]|uniref:GNAT family N-acetyltransferase n=1 Tax=Actinomadura geliboluensis TaxID=882440 RepID=UPI0037207F38